MDTLNLDTVSPVLAAYVQVLENIMPDDARQRLVSYLPRLIGTAGNAEADRRRGYIAADDAIRVLAPLALDAAGLREEADALRSLAPVTDAKTAQVARVARVAELARAEAAWRAARAAADAAADADAVWAVWVAARAAWAAARAAVRAGADPTRVWDSALDLLDRLIDA